MLQVVQNISTGDLTLETVPPPALHPGFVQVHTGASLISAGTEKMLIDLAQKSLIGKAQARPDLVRQVLAKVQKEGFLTTYRNVRSKLERSMPLGYSAAGVVEAVGVGVTGVQAGERVAVAGAGYANHAEVNVVPKNLVARIPEGVSFEEAAFTTVASIALQGVRLARPELGDNVVVIGLGLIGLITVQLLKANGCRVLGIDLDPNKIALGQRMGMDAGVASTHDEVERMVDRFTGGYGADHTLITAATKSNHPVELAGAITRRKGQVVVVGAVGMDIPRDVYYKKELEIKVSMSYGPGRYDPSYEEGGIDYPYDYVRWTEQRNMEAVLDLMGQGKIDIQSLITHRFTIDEALEAYALIQKGEEPYIGIVLTYDLNAAQQPVVQLSGAAESTLSEHEPKDRLAIGFAGAGNYAAQHLLPYLMKRSDVALRGLATATGPSARQNAEKFGFAYCSTDFEQLVADEEIEAVFIATRHSTHAEFACRALEAGKHVFVEKPLVVNEEQLQGVREAYQRANQLKPTALMVGLNRRFAPMIHRLRDAVQKGGAKQMVYRVNSGAIPPTSWLHAEEEGGGMLIGEACHFLDVMRFVAGASPVRVYAQRLTLRTAALAAEDNISILVTFADGSTGTLCYSTVGDKSAPKERFEVFSGGTVAMLDDFRRLEIYRDGKRTRKKASNQDKGQARQIEQTVRAFRERGQAPIAFGELIEVMHVVFAAQHSMASGEPVVLSDAAAAHDGVPAGATRIT